MRYHTVDSHSGEVVRESNYLTMGRVSPSKRTYTKRQPGICLSKEEAWAAAMVIFFLGVWFAH